MILSGFGQQKTKPNKANIIVQCSADCDKNTEKLFEKTKPICRRSKMAHIQ